MARKVLWVDGPNEKTDEDIPNAIKALRKNGDRVEHVEVKSGEELGKLHAARLAHDCVVFSNVDSLLKTDQSAVEAFLSQGGKPTVVHETNSLPLQAIMQKNPHVQQVNPGLVMPENWPSIIQQVTQTQHQPPRHEAKTEIGG